MAERLPNYAEFSSDEREELIVLLFVELQQLHCAVEKLRNRIDLLEAENRQFREESKELCGKPAKNSQHLPMMARKSHSRKVCENPTVKSWEAGKDNRQRD